MRIPPVRLACLYNYEKGAKLSKFDDPMLITFANLENILDDYKLNHFSKEIPDEKIIPIIENLLTSYQYYTKYYFDELVTVQNSN